MNDKTNQEILKAFRIGIEIELKGMETYLEFAKRTLDLTGKNMFIILARDELDHFHILSQSLSSMEIEGNPGKVKIPESIIQRVTPRLKDRDSRIKGKEGADQINALTMALDQERRSIELYRQHLSKNIAPETRRIFQKLMEMEEAHYDIIQAELDSINETGFWFQIPEFNMED